MYMKYYDFYSRNVILFQILANVFKANGIKIGVELSDSDLPRVSGASSSSSEGVYIRIRQYHSLSEELEQKIRNIFPIKIKDYTVRLHGISDFEYDDDRMWEPSVSFGFYKDGVNVLDKYTLPKERHWSDKSHFKLV